MLTKGKMFPRRSDRIFSEKRTCRHSFLRALFDILLGSARVRLPPEAVVKG